MDSRISSIVQRRTAGESVQDIAASLGLTRARVHQILKRAHESGDYAVHVQIVSSADGVAREDVARILRRALAAHGLSTSK